MNVDTKLFFVNGSAGRLECALDLPKKEPVGIAILAHPHPLYGGTMSNKVVQMMARAFIGLDYLAVRMNFRGVGNRKERMTSVMVKPTIWPYFLNTCVENIRDCPSCWADFHSEPTSSRVCRKKWLRRAGRRRKWFLSAQQQENGQWKKYLRVPF